MPVSVLTVARPAICGAGFMRRPSRTRSFSVSKVSIVSIEVTLAALELLDDVIEDLERPRHPQADQARADAFGGDPRRAHDLLRLSPTFQLFLRRLEGCDIIPSGRNGHDHSSPRNVRLIWAGR
jgi:hypothetical protein